mgnify:CR=1 FL=1
MRQVALSVKIHLADYYPLIRETLDQGGTFSLTITGQSMYPFILGNRDRVTLSPITGKLKKNDLPFYRRANGQFVLHRIVKVEKDGTYTCCGDHQWWLEKGLKHDQMIGVATEYVRKGKRLTNKNIIYRIYRTVWTWLLRYRKYFFALYSKAVTLFRRNKAS